MYVHVIDSGAVAPGKLKFPLASVVTTPAELVKRAYRIGCAVAGCPGSSG